MMVVMVVDDGVLVDDGGRSNCDGGEDASMTMIITSMDRVEDDMMMMVMCLW